MKNLNTFLIEHSFGTQVVKGAVRKTVNRRSESDPKLQTMESWPSLADGAGLENRNPLKRV